MKITVNHVGQFRDAFHAAGREEKFSYEALELLFDYLEECDPDMELNVIAICCDYTESTPDEVIDAYSIEYDEDEPEDEDAAIAFLERHTSIVGTTASGSIVYASNF